MPLSHKLLKDIQETDLCNLVENRVGESRTIDYKQCLKVETPEQNKEFLRDVTAFANASGGDLVYGVEEGPRGLPKELCGTHIGNEDELKQKLENLIRTGVQPRLTGYDMRAIAIGNGKWVWIVRVARSWAGPHMVTIGKEWRFFTRNSSGRHPMDAAELRVGFALSEILTERMRRFRAERLEVILSNDAPVQLVSKPLMVLHIVPFQAFDPATRVDRSRCWELFQGRDRGLFKTEFTPCRPYGDSFEGFFTYGESMEPDRAACYLLVFREGMIEAVNAHIVDSNDSVWCRQRERDLVRSVPNYLKLLQSLGLTPPLALMLTLKGLRGRRIACRESAVTTPHVNSFRRDELLLREIIVDSFECVPDKVFKPAFDAVWQAAGWRGSMNYDAHGCWKSK